MPITSSSDFYLQPICLKTHKGLLSFLHFYHPDSFFDLCHILFGFPPSIMASFSWLFLVLLQIIKLILLWMATTLTSTTTSTSTRIRVDGLLWIVLAYFELFLLWKEEVSRPMFFSSRISIEIKYVQQGILYLTLMEVMNFFCYSPRPSKKSLTKSSS